MVNRSALWEKNLTAAFLVYAIYCYNSAPHWWVILDVNRSERGMAALLLLVLSFMDSWADIFLSRLSKDIKDPA